MGSVSQIDRVMPVSHTKLRRCRSERRLLRLKPRRGGLTLAQGNALGNAVQIPLSPERAFQCQSAIAGSISAPFQGLDSVCDVNPGRCPGLELGRATEVGLAQLRRHRCRNRQQPISIGAGEQSFEVPEKGAMDRRF